MNNTHKGEKINVQRIKTINRKSCERFHLITETPTLVIHSSIHSMFLFSDFIQSVVYSSSIFGILVGGGIVILCA